MYKQVFEDIIKQDTLYGGILLTVKAKYDEYLDKAAASQSESSRAEEHLLRKIEREDKRLKKLE